MQGLMKGAAELNHNIVALCDVDSNRIAESRKNLGAAGEKAKAYKDYRELLEKEKSVDAVIIATPDHWHAAICVAAIKAGKHVYCEKPLTHTIGEARQLAAVAKESKVVTQTGNQGSASPNFRRSMELIQAGVIGSVSEVHLWHPRHGWPCGIETPTTSEVIPDGLDWDFWIGPAPMRPYQKGIYHPAQWRGWYDFGGGSLADFCCHGFSMPVRALDLDYPNKIEISGTAIAKDSFPKTCRVHFTFAARGNRGPLSIHFHSGGDLPDRQVTAGMKETLDKVPETGCLVLGDKGTISAGLWNNECRIKMKGETSFNGTNHDAAKPIPETLPRARGSHIQEWIEACKGQGKTFSPFEIGGHVTEIGAAGLVALRLGRNIEWDGATMTVKGSPEAATLVKPQHRGEWGL
jgi:predicted dehydrogenase